VVEPNRNIKGEALATTDILMAEGSQGEEDGNSLDLQNQRTKPMMLNWRSLVADKKFVEN